MLIHSKVVALSEMPSVEIRSYSRISRIEKLNSILEEGNSCFSLSFSLVLKSQGKNLADLLPYMGSIQKAHEDREAPQPYLPAAFLKFYNLKETTHVNLDAHQLKEADFSSLIFIHFDQDRIFHVLALLKDRESYGLFDANYKSIEVKMYPDVTSVRDQLQRSIEHYKNLRGCETVSLEKVSYSAE